jgi:hypothetical protein
MRLEGAKITIFHDIKKRKHAGSPIFGFGDLARRIRPGEAID